MAALMNFTAIRSDKQFVEIVYDFIGLCRNNLVQQVCGSIKGAEDRQPD